MELDLRRGTRYFERRGAHLKHLFVERHQFYKAACCQHPVLLTEAPLNPRSNRDVAAQIFFDTFNVPALFTSVQAVLALWVMLMSLNAYQLSYPADTPQVGQQE